jgi:hypothetical protein
MYYKKLNFNPTNFHHHRSGWHPIAKSLHDTLYNKDGIVFYDWADKVFKEKTILINPWCGILHNVIRYPKHEYIQKYTDRIYPLEELVTQPHFLKSLKSCKGIFTLSKNTAEFLKTAVNCEVYALTHPILHEGKKFYWKEYLLNKKIVTIGQWLRRYHSICELKTSQKKILIKTNGYDSDYKEMLKYSTCSNVEIKNYLQPVQYDKILASCLVFLHLYDVAACNVVLECIIRATPLLINKLPATLEYLGESYPLFYETLKEAEDKLNSSDLIHKAHLYLKNANKDKLSVNYFISSLAESKIYQDILC